MTGWGGQRRSSWQTQQRDYKQKLTIKEHSLLNEWYKVKQNEFCEGPNEEVYDWNCLSHPWNK